MKISREQHALPHWEALAIIRVVTLPPKRCNRSIASNSHWGLVGRICQMRWYSAWSNGICSIILTATSTSLMLINHWNTYTSCLALPMITPSIRAHGVFLSANHMLGLFTGLYRKSCNAYRTETGALNHLSTDSDIKDYIFEYFPSKHFFKKKE